VSRLDTNGCHVAIQLKKGLNMAVVFLVMAIVAVLCGIVAWRQLGARG
jgi:hypothetical protein